MFAEHYRLLCAWLLLSNTPYGSAVVIVCKCTVGCVHRKLEYNLILFCVYFMITCIEYRYWVSVGQTICGLTCKLRNHCPEFRVQFSLLCSILNSLFISLSFLKFGSSVYHHTDWYLSFLKRSLHFTSVSFHTPNQSYAIGVRYRFLVEQNYSVFFFRTFSHSKYKIENSVLICMTIQGIVSVANNQLFWKVTFLFWLTIANNRRSGEDDFNSAQIGIVGGNAKNIAHILTWCHFKFGIQPNFPFFFERSHTLWIGSLVRFFFLKPNKRIW